MDAFTQLAEERMQRAEEQGAFRNLPGRGQPLKLEDLSQVPDELRAGYLLLKSNGFLPPELEARKQWLQLEDLLSVCIDADERDRLRNCAVQAREHYRALLEQRQPRLPGYFARL